MNEKEKRDYLEEYGHEKHEGEAVFPVLVALAYFVGAPLEARADPSDTTYTPRPEWYFLFLFQLLKYFPGNLEVVGVIVLPFLALAALVLLPFLDRTTKRHFFNRPVVTGVASFLILAVLGLTIQPGREAPPPAEVEQGDEVAGPDREGGGEGKR